MPGSPLSGDEFVECVPFRSPSLRAAAIPKRRRSRMITLEGIIAAKKEQQQAEREKEKEGKDCSFINAVGGGQTMKAPKGKKTRLEAEQKDSDRPKFIMHEVGTLKLVIRRVKPSESQSVCSDGRTKRKIEDAGLPDENHRNMKKAKLMSESPTEAMVIDVAQCEAAEKHAPVTSSPLELPSNQCEESVSSHGKEQQNTLP